MNIPEYYDDSYVQSRLIEYMGGRSLNDVTCQYITRCDQSFYESEPKPPTQLKDFLSKGWDLCRSLSDTKFFIVHLDIEYVNFDFPAEVYLDSRRSFSLQQPVVKTVKKLLSQYGITPLHLLSGRGHHFVWQIPLHSDIFQQLTDLSELTHASPAELSQNPADAYGQTNKERIQAFNGVGLLIEYFINRVKDIAQNATEIPIELCAVKVGPQKRGREIISLDISEYADPLKTRMIRMPFSVYLKTREKPWIIPEGYNAERPYIITIPLKGISYQRGLNIRNNLDSCLDLARHCSVKIPNNRSGMIKLMKEYKASSLADFHQWFYSQEAENPDNWPQSYDQLSLDMFPPCIQYILQNPHELLLQPEAIRQITAVFLAVGWHPRHIAGYIRSKYERDHGWGDLWYKYNAAKRAEFYTRIYTGQIVTGRDDLIDLNCVCAKEKEICFHDTSKCELNNFQQSILKRRSHDRLACRPFNRLFL
jgi:hypothetical protein